MSALGHMASSTCKLMIGTLMSSASNPSSIQWYPGHMHKATKTIKESLGQVDLIIEVLDARIPFSSENPMIASLRGNKPVIKLLTKEDLADASITQAWQDFFEQQKNVKTQAINMHEPERIRKITELCRKMVPNKNIVHALIMGIPNVGKSTLINILAGRNIAKTGNEPAVTKSQQRINLANNIVLSDTPGLLWPKIENPNSGYRLATTGAIKETAIDADDVAFYAAEALLKLYPERLQERYQLESLPTSELELIEAIGRKRGCLRSGGQVELNKACSLLLKELRAGLLGPISLETPDVIARELEQLAKDNARKAAEKEVKQQERQKRKKRRR